MSKDVVRSQKCKSDNAIDVLVLRICLVSQSGSSRQSAGGG